MFRSKSINMKGKQRNILLIGPSETSFVSIFEEFWKCFDIQRNKLEGFIGNGCKRTTETTRSYLTVFDEKLCFIDTPSDMKSFEIRNLYETLLDIKVIDAILVFADCYLQELELYMQQFFTASNYPREKVIFIVNIDNTAVAMVNLEKKLKELNMTNKILTNKNLFLEKDVFSVKGMLTFCNRLKVVFTLQPCAFAFSDIPNLSKGISDMFPALIEILQNIDITRPHKLSWGPKEWIICETCSTNKRVTTICNNESEFLENLEFQVLQKCSKCYCAMKDHYKNRMTTMRSQYFNQESIEFEKTTILHILATFYLFCKQGNGLPDIYKDFRKEYWSLVKQRVIMSWDSIYTEIEDKIKELESNSFQPTREEVTFLLESLEKEKWVSFQMLDFIKVTCELKLIPNLPTTGQSSTSKATELNSQMPQRFPEMKTKVTHNASGSDEKESAEDIKAVIPNLPTTGQTSTSKATELNSQMPQKFPEMKTKVTHNASGSDEKESAKDIKAVMEVVRKVAYELSLNKEKNEEETMKNQIEILKQKIEDL